MPPIAKIKINKKNNVIAAAKGRIDEPIDFMIILKALRLVILLRGRKIRKERRTCKLKLEPAVISSQNVTRTRKSSRFHFFLKYEDFDLIGPKLKSFIKNSVVYVTKKKISRPESS